MKADKDTFDVLQVSIGIYYQLPPFPVHRSTLQGSITDQYILCSVLPERESMLILHVILFNGTDFTVIICYL
jgi:hypothetical protein